MESLEERVERLEQRGSWYAEEVRILEEMLNSVVLQLLGTIEDVPLDRFKVKYFGHGQYTLGIAYIDGDKRRAFRLGHDDLEGLLSKVKRQLVPHE